MDTLKTLLAAAITFGVTASMFEGGFIGWPEIIGIAATVLVLGLISKY